MKKQAIVISLLAILIASILMMGSGCINELPPINVTGQVLSITEEQAPQSPCDWAVYFWVKFDNGIECPLNITATRLEIGQIYKLSLHHASYVIGRWRNLSDMYEIISMTLLSDNLTPYPPIVISKMKKSSFNLGASYLGNNADGLGYDGLCKKVMLSNNVTYWIPFDFPLPIKDIEYEWTISPAGQIIGYK